MRSLAAWSVALAAGMVIVAAQDQAVRLRVTQRDLVPLCLNGKPPASDARAWDLAPGPVSLAVSMRIDPRPGQTATEPGTAAIHFTAEAGHRYEVEVRADPMAFSTRAWRVHEWTPVVRDRTTDRLVSTDPVWVERACG